MQEPIKSPLAVQVRQNFFLFCFLLAHLILDTYNNHSLSSVRKPLTDSDPGHVIKGKNTLGSKNGGVPGCPISCVTRDAFSLLTIVEGILKSLSEKNPLIR